MNTPGYRYVPSVALARLLDAPAGSGLRAAAVRRRRRLTDPGLRAPQPDLLAHPAHPLSPGAAPAPPGLSSKDVRDQIRRQRLSPTIEHWVRGYAGVGRRDLYLWQWCQRGVELTTLPGVLPELRAAARDSKILAGMFNVLLDDVTDEQRNGKLLAELLKLEHGERPQLDSFSPLEREYAEFACRVWDALWDRLGRYPGFKKYRSLLEFDFKQLFNNIRYSHLLNSNPALLNVAEHDLYSPHGMMLMCFATIDLMCMPRFESAELGKLREAIWHVQWMARIGNLVSTWPREVAGRDYTSGVFARAVRDGELSISQLAGAEPQEIESVVRRSGQEQRFLCQWNYHRACLESMKPHLRSVDLERVLAGAERLLDTELSSRGWK